MVVSYFHELDRNFEVFQEVDSPRGPIDIVVRLGSIIHVIECKLRFGFDLLEQAESRIPYAHKVSMAVPNRGKIHYGNRLAKMLGMGVISVDPGLGAYESVKESVAPKIRRKISDRLSSRLYEEQKTYAAAGSVGIKRWTPFKETSKLLKKFVSENPGADMKTIVTSINHHYRCDSNARSSIIQNIRDGFIDGIRIEKSGRKINLYPEE